jgi:hypothetical protein
MNFHYYAHVFFLLTLFFIYPGTPASKADVLCGNNRSGTVRIRPGECESNETEVDLSGIAQSPAVKPPRWRWLGAGEGTYWYVPKGNLPAVEWDTSDPETYSPVVDQTVWHIDHYADGYFSGTVVAQIGLHPPQCQYLIGSVTPYGAVYITFNSLTSPPVGSPVLTTGVGRMVLKGKDWTFNMQMASGSASNQVTHWAYMLECAPDQRCWTDLPGVQQSLPDFLSNCTAD